MAILPLFLNMIDHGRLFSPRRLYNTWILLITAFDIRGMRTATHHTGGFWTRVIILYL